MPTSRTATRQIVTSRVAFEAWPRSDGVGTGSVGRGTDEPYVMPGDFAGQTEPGDTFRFRDLDG
jgi:hypothetical protein